MPDTNKEQPTVEITEEQHQEYLQLKETFENAITQQVQQLFNHYKPGTPEKHTDYMTTSEMFTLVNEHLPDMITPQQLVALLSKNKYQSKFIPEERTLAWLVNTW